MASTSDSFDTSNHSGPISGYTRLVRTVGYVLLLLILLDVVAMLIPPQFMNPSWEFQRFGELVEKIIIPLLAIVMIYFKEEQNRGKFEQFVLKLLSWLCLLAGIALIVLIPLSASNVLRLNQQADTATETQFAQQLNQAEQIELQFSQAPDTQIKQFLESQGRSLNNKSPQQVKKEFLSQLAKNKQEIRQAYQAKRNEQRTNLLKRAIKWSLGALVSGFLFIYIWRLTRWTRTSQ